MTLLYHWPALAITACIVSASCQGACPDFSFRSSTVLGIGANPRAVAAADFNRDRVTDLAVPNFDDGTVSILLGRGDGSFVPGLSLFAGAGAKAIATADFNSDSHPDLAVAVSELAEIAIFLGMGNGLFGPAIRVDGGDHPFDLTAADLNHDGADDLVVAENGCPGCRIDGSVLVILGRGDGQFLPTVSYGRRGFPTGVRVADFNGDKHADVLVADAFRVRLLAGNGDGTLKDGVVFDPIPEPLALAVADFDNDGFLDFAAASPSTQEIAIWLGRSGGLFIDHDRLPTRLSALPISMEAEDFNGDHLPDLAAANIGNDTVSVWPGLGNGRFGPMIEIQTGGEPGALLCADIDGDGRPDLVCCDQNPGDLTIFLNTCPDSRPRLTIDRFRGETLVSWRDAGGSLTLEVAGSPTTGVWLPSTTAGHFRNGNRFSAVKPGFYRLALHPRGR